jgi:hypothetical protein
MSSTSQTEQFSGPLECLCRKPVDFFSAFFSPLESFNSGFDDSGGFSAVSGSGSGTLVTDMRKKSVFVWNRSLHTDSGKLGLEPKNPIIQLEIAKSDLGESNTVQSPRDACQLL